jgi:hypothetical protein
MRHDSIDCSKYHSRKSDSESQRGESESDRVASCDMAHFVFYMGQDSERENFDFRGGQNLISGGGGVESDFNTQRHLF